MSKFRFLRYHIAEFYMQELPSVDVARHGWIDGGLCPFHEDKRSGSFKINLETGGFICFSCQTKGGDIVSFNMKRYDLTFREAICDLASRSLYQEGAVYVE